MNKKMLFSLWGGSYALCALLGFIPQPEGAIKVLLVMFAAASFVPPLLLIHRCDVKAAKIVRNLAALWILVTVILIILNYLTYSASYRMGNFCYSLLVILSSPMVCGQYWVLGLFGWSYLLSDSVNRLRK